MANGIRVAKPFKKASSSNKEDLLYTSETLSPKVYLKVSGEIKTDASGNATFYIPHDLDYSPVYLIYINPCKSIVNDQLPFVGSWGLIDNNFAWAISQKGTIRVDLESSGNQVLYKYVAFILADPAKDE